MEVAELWGWVETLLVNLGIWPILTAAITIMITISVGKFAIDMLRR